MTNLKWAEHLAQYSLTELRRRQRLCETQTGRAYKLAQERDMVLRERGLRALTKLHEMANALTEAVMIKTGVYAMNQYCGTFTKYGYTILYREGRTRNHNSCEVYSAGNCLWDSQQTLNPAGGHGVADLATIEKWCNQTGKEMADENHGIWYGCDYDEDEEQEITTVAMKGGARDSQCVDMDDKRIPINKTIAELRAAIARATGGK